MQLAFCTQIAIRFLNSNWMLDAAAVLQLW